MYYLQTRYYDANICRFINADSALYDKILGYNLYAYCDNNPVSFIDPTGRFCVAHIDDRNPLDNWLLEGAGAGGNGATGNHFGYGTSYYNYSVYSTTSAYNAYVGGYYSNSISTGITNPGYYYVPGAVSVNDSSVRPTSKVSYNVNGYKSKTSIQRGWKLGDDIRNFTKAGNVPSWTTVRQRFWKNQAFYNASQYSSDGLNRMKKGLAPIANSMPMELHHPYGRSGENFFIFEQLTYAEHYFNHYGRYP